MNIVKEKTSTAAVKQAILDLIQAGTTFDIAALDRIYHDDMQVVSIDIEGKLSIANKAAFKGLFEMKLEAGDPPLQTWSKFNHIEVKDQNAHVLISRKVNLTGEDQFLVLSIDLVYESDRWQVTREVIFARPNETIA